jgi:hypothetical protein
MAVSAVPQPPYLCIREGISFWVETRPVTDVSATRQAYEEGCYRELSCYDGSGRLWPVLTATMSTDALERPVEGWWQRLVGPPPQFRVSLDVGPSRSVDVQEILSRLTRILQSNNEFCEDLPIVAAEILRQFAAARAPDEIIRIASRC